MHITKPTLIINKIIAVSNIHRMAEKARKNGIAFEPHFKTHQSKEVGEWFRQEGVRSITVSSVTMAEYFAANNWHDITIAFPVNILELDKIDELAKRIDLTLLVTDSEVLERLNELEYPVSLYIEIDAGYNRSGVLYDDCEKIRGIIDDIKRTNHQFKGFYCHSGNSYYARGRQEIEALYSQVQNRLLALKKEFQIHEPRLAIGDTPTCSVIEKYEGIDSIHPGNFVYYDVTQVEIGSCNLQDIAVSVDCPVVMKNEQRNELVIYGGGVHLSKEHLEVDGKSIYGLVAQIDEKGEPVLLPNTYLKSLSQEHGVIATTPEVIQSIHQGDVLSIVPVHSCMVVDCMQMGYTLEGETITQMRK